MIQENVIDCSGHSSINPRYQSLNKACGTTPLNATTPQSYGSEGGLSDIPTGSDSFSSVTESSGTSGSHPSIDLPEDEASDESSDETILRQTESVAWNHLAIFRSLALPPSEYGLQILRLTGTNEPCSAG